MSTLKTYFVIFSNTSRCSTIGLRPTVTQMFDKTIIEIAQKELMRCGETMEDMAGIEWIEDENESFRPARELTYDEIFALSVEKLGDDGRLFYIFNTDEAGAADFVETAEFYGLKEEARAIVAEFYGLKEKARAIVDNW